MYTNYIYIILYTAHTHIQTYLYTLKFLAEDVRECLFFIKPRKSAIIFTMLDHMHFIKEFVSLRFVLNQNGVSAIGVIIIIIIIIIALCTRHTRKC